MNPKAIEYFLFSVFVLCSCTPSKNPLPMVSLTSPTIVAPTTGIPTSPSKVSNPIIYAEANFSCETFVSTKWGDEINEFGFLREQYSQDYQIPSPYPPTFDMQGNMFITDRVNERILMYQIGNKTPKIVHIPELYTPEFMPKAIPWMSNISVSNNRIHFLVEGIRSNRNVFRLFSLSIQNNDLKVTDLEPYYPHRAIHNDSVLADKHGGVYVFLDNIIIHYNEKFQSNLLASDEILHFIYFIVGWDGNLYTQGAPDVINNWGIDIKSFDMHPNYVFQDVHPTLTGSIDKSIHYTLIGADITGRLYFLQYYNLHGETKNEKSIIRFDIPTQTGEIGKIKNKDWLSYNYEVAPDGALYSLIFDPKDSSVQPKVIRCRFQ